MSQLLCARCFENSNKTVYACQRPGCTKEGLPQDGKASADSQLICEQCQTLLTTRVCPDCGYVLDGWENDPLTLPFSIVGAEGSGKSCYISVMLNRVKADLAKYYSCALHQLGGDATIALYERQYYHPLFVQGRCPEPTLPEDIAPLKYSLVFSGQPPAGKTCNLTFYDSCGKTFESERTLAAYGRNIYHSKGIFLMLDPSQLPGVGDAFKMQGRPVLDYDITALISRIIQLIRGGLGIKNMQQQINIPIAVCLTKLDTVRSLLDPSSFVGGSSRHFNHADSPHMDKLDLNSCDLEVQSLIESWAGKDLVNQIRGQFKDCAFFALSSLGTSPNENGMVHRMSPHRVLDPLLWLLWKNGNISCK